MKTKHAELADNSRFHGDLELKDGKMKGIFILPGGFACNYSLAEQKTGAKYAVRGSVSLIDPKTGTTMKIRRAVRKDTQVSDAEELPAEPAPSKSTLVDARSTVYSHSKDGQDLRQKIAACAMALYNEKILLLYDSAEKTVPIEEMKLSMASSLFMDKYLNARGRSEASQKTRKQRLARICKMLGGETISSISLRKIGKACKEIDSNWRVYIQEASNFLDFILNLKRDSSGKNVFRDYLEQHPTERQRNAHHLQMKAANSDILSREEENELDQAILANIDNGLLIGVLLVKEGGFSSARACELTWAEVEKIEGIPGMLKVEYHLENNTGAVHDYSFPLFPVGSMILLKRRAWLGERYSAAKIAKMTIASDEHDPRKPLDPSVLTERSRNILRNFGVGYAELAALQDFKSGAGINMLLNTYRHRLEEICGLKNDPALANFLMHHSMANMLQANHYRSFTDPVALKMIVGILNRDPRMKKESVHIRGYKRKKDGRDEQFTVFAKSSQEHAFATVKLRLQPGQKVQIMAPHGCLTALTTLGANTSQAHC